MAARRRERDETRVFKRMGEGLARATDKVEHHAFVNDMLRETDEMLSKHDNSNDSTVYQGGAAPRRGK